MKPNQELLPKENFITLYFSIIVQIHKKIRGQEAMVSSVQTGLKDLRIFRHANSRICLMFSTFGNLIYSSILEDGVHMSTRMKSNTLCSVWNTPCPVWYSSTFAIVGTISLSGQLFWILLNCHNWHLYRNFIFFNTNDII
jgi:hypothetical protein